VRHRHNTDEETTGGAGTAVVGFTRRRLSIDDFQDRLLQPRRRPYPLRNSENKNPIRLVMNDN
jgi:hypothetical protein